VVTAEQVVSGNDGLGAAATRAAVARPRSTALENISIDLIPCESDRSCEIEDGDVYDKLTEEAEMIVGRRLRFEVERLGV